MDDLRGLGFDARLRGHEVVRAREDGPVIDLDGGTGAGMLERVLAQLPVDFESLPIVADGDSKQVRRWTDRVVLMKFKPTVYSFTTNRYGEAPGTDALRLRFTAALFRRMAGRWNGGPYRHAFLAELATPAGPLLAQRCVEPGNLEVRVKRYHIGSPVHRYRYTDRHAAFQGGGPVRRWSRFDVPVVCFDWRHPLRDDDGNRLADEPLSDDYARVWMGDVDHAKAMARDVFLWMEAWFAASRVRLVDLCLFVDRAGRTIFGEISPDCMRAQLTLGDPAEAESADKDLWRSGRTPEMLLARYEELYRRVFDGNQREES